MSDPNPPLVALLDPEPTKDEQELARSFANWVEFTAPHIDKIASMFLQRLKEHRVASVRKAYEDAAGRVAALSETTRELIGDIHYLIAEIDRSREECEKMAKGLRAVLKHEDVFSHDGTNYDEDECEVCAGIEVARQILAAHDAAKERGKG